MEYKDLNDDQLIHLGRLRLDHEEDEVVTSLVVRHKGHSKAHNTYSVQFLVKYKEFKDGLLGIVFNKFYPDEFLYLQEIGIDFKKIYEIKRGN